MTTGRYDAGSRISLIGGGRLGTMLGHALAAGGFDIAAVSCRTPASARESARIIGGARATTSIFQAAGAADIVFLCLPDDAVAPAVRRLAGRKSSWCGKTIFHTSGLLPSEVLAPLKAGGASVASFHPAQTFPRKDASPAAFHGVAFVLEGDSEAVALGRRIVRRLKGRALSLKPEGKALYHAACHLASGGVISLLDASSTLLRKAGLDSRQAAAVWAPLVEKSLQNVKEFGPAKALTGPIVRGDLRTVRAHLAALAGDPRIRIIYKGLALRALALTSKDKIPARTVRAWMRLLERK